MGDWMRYVRLAGRACDNRFRHIGWRGPLLLAVSVLDVFLYATAISLVMSVVLGIGGLERFVLILIGLAVLRWSMSCAIQASRMAHFVRICAPVMSKPLTASVIVAVAPSTVVFLLTAVVIIVFSERPPGSLGHILGWGLMMFLIQLSWNVLLAATVVQLRLRRILPSEVPLVVLFALLLIISPVVYQFSDLPQPASQILTSFNPASHLIAGYQNAIWYLNDVSLEVLPLSAGLAVLGVIAIGTLLSVPGISTSSNPTAQAPTRSPKYLAWRDGRWAPLHEGFTGGKLPAHRPWRGELPPVSARTLLYLLGPFLRAQLGSGQSFPESGKLLMQTVGAESTLPIYAERTRDQLCALLALATENEPIVLDGVLDGLDAAGMQAFTDIVSKVYGDGSRIIVVSYDRDANDCLARTAYS